MTEARFLTKAKETYKYHRAKLQLNDNWTVTMTARLLRRSLGSICEDLMIARFCKDHEKELERFDYAYQALSYIREHQREKDLEGID